MKTIAISLFSIGLVAWLGPGLTAANAASPLKVGDPAPPFELQGSDGKTYKLSDFKGKQAVVLAWFPKAFTGGCTRECKSIKEDGEAIRKFDVVYFTASTDQMDGEKGNKAFAESLGVDYPILSDPEGSTAKAYSVLGGNGMARRWTFFINKDGKIAEIDKEVDKKLASGHYGNEVAAKLK